MTTLDRWRPGARALRRALDVDLWRPARPGQDDALDADRFAAWLEELMNGETADVLETLASVDDDLTAAAFAQHVRVFDIATVENADRPRVEIGGYVVEPRRLDTWEAMTAVLQALETDRPDDFHRVMRDVRALSNSRPEIDGLNALLVGIEQHVYDVGARREERRGRAGYAAPADARAFLAGARVVRLDAAAAPPPDPVVEAYFRAIGVTRSSSDERLGGRQPRALPVGPGAPSRYVRLQAHMQFVREVDDTLSLLQTSELAFLANALAAGVAIQDRAVTTNEATEAAAAVCNLGLENWPTRWRPTADLIKVFQVGWAMLYQEVCMAAAGGLRSAAADARTEDVEIRNGLLQLRMEVAREWRAGTPWRARTALDAMLLVDQPAWAALVGLIAECPVIHAGLRATLESAATIVDPSAYELISTNRQIEDVRQFIRRLPEILAVAGR